MLIDRTHTRWAILTSALLVASAGVYVWQWQTDPAGPRGGSATGLLFGIAGSACMVFAGLLTARKKRPRWRLGSAQWWLRGHIWLGALSLPLILFHSGFRLGGWLEFLLMMVFFAEILSGFIGLALQQAIPRMMRTMAPSQAIYEQIPVVCERLRSAADLLVMEQIKTSNLSLFDPPLRIDTAGNLPTASPSSHEILRDFYLGEVRPFLLADNVRHESFRDATVAEVRLTSVQNTLPAALRPVIDDLKAICNERRELLVQQRLHAWLHAWLLVHVPLSTALLGLAIVHILTALYY